MWEKLLRGYCLVTAKQWAVRARAQHHIGFRYYRLAQSTEDLYDGFRNMYLAFEVLLSSKYPKVRGEQEPLEFSRLAVSRCLRRESTSRNR